MSDDGYIPRATADKLAMDFPLGERHQAKVEIATSLIGSGMSPLAVEVELRNKFSEATEKEIADVVNWCVKNIAPNSGYRSQPNGGYRPRNGYGTLPWSPLGPKPPDRTPNEQMEWWLDGFRMSEEGLRGLSPIQLPIEDGEALALALATLYQEEETLNIVTDYTLTDKGKANPDGIGTSKTVQEWVEYFALYEIPMSDAGAWLRINPVNGKPSGDRGGYTDDDITAFRYFLIEFDKTPLEMQMAFFAKCKLPVAAVLKSGGKSVHAWIKIGAADKEQFKERAKRLTEAMKPFGSDAANKNPSRLSRLPSAVRKIQAAGDGVQRLLYLNPLALELTDAGIREFEQSLTVPVVQDRPMLVLVKDAMDRYEYMRANQGKLGVPIGIPELDQMSGGMKPGHTTVVAGATGGCKTTLAIHAVKSALAADYGVLLFSLEMDKEEIFDLLLSDFCSINRNKFNNGNFTDYDFEQIAAQLPSMAKLPLFIEDSAMNSTEQIRLRTLQLAAEKRIGLVVVDYIQFVNPGLTKENREQQVAQISHGLRVLARESKLPMMVLSQLNDEGKLRESRVIAHNANTVLLVEVQNAELPNEFDKLKVSVVKGRGIPTGNYFLNFNRSYARLFAQAEIRDQQDQPELGEPTQ